MESVTGLRQRLHLSGTWQLAFDPGGEGVADGWMDERWPESRSDLVQVPAIWNLTHPDAEGVGFYRRVFTIPAGWPRGALELDFQGSSYRTDAWLNGQHLGSHEGSYTPFSFDATPAARVGAENVLVLRIAALSRNDAVDGMVLSQSPASKQSWYYTYGGLWGDVSLIARPPVSCQAVRIEPHLLGEVSTVELETRNDHPQARQAEFHLELLTADGQEVLTGTFDASIPPGTARFAYRLDMPRPRPWTCADPHLYSLRVAVREHGEDVDRKHIRFGMRDFSVHDGQFFLNGAPIFLRGVLLQPNYPMSLVTPPSRDMMVREITLMKEAGFNMIRAHVRPAPPGYLDLTDEMGMLVYAESSLTWIKDSPRLLDHGRRELQAMMERDRNHPSVVVWGIHNENRAASALTSGALTRLARSLDPTRVVVDNSGGSMAIDQDFGWVDRTTVVPDREAVREAIQDVHLYVGAPIPGGVYEWLRTLGMSPPPVDIAAYSLGSPAMSAEWARELRTYGGKIFVSELGCGGMADLDDVVANYGDGQQLRDAREAAAFRDSLHEGFAARHLDRMFDSVQELISATQEQQAAGNSRQIEALLANPRVSGYILVQLNDVAGNGEFHAGILDHWRNPKRAYHAVKRLNGPHLLILKAASPVVGPGDSADVALTAITQVPLHGGEEVVVRVSGPQGQDLLTERRPVSAGMGIKELGTISFKTEDGAGWYRLAARLTSGEEVLAESTEAVLTLPSPDWSTLPSHIAWVGAHDVGVGENASAIRGQEVRTAEGQVRLVVAPRPRSLTPADWDTLLAAADAGGVAVIGPLHPEDELAKRVLAARGLKLDLHFGIGNWIGCYHWIPASELFEGLPAGGLAGEAYVDVLPHYVMSELGGEVLAGSLRNTQTRYEAPAMLWYSDIEAIRFGSGTLFFCQYRIFEQVTTNPLAGKLLCNLLRLGGSSSSSVLTEAAAGQSGVTRRTARSDNKSTRR